MIFPASLPGEASLVSAGDLSAHHFPGRSSGHHFLAPASLTSWRSQPCVPGCFSGHCDLAKPALRPPMLFGALRPAEGGIASYFSSD